MTDPTQAVDLGSVVHVLRLARDGWPEGCEWATDAFAFAVWNDYFAGRGDEEVRLSAAGQAFLAKVGPLYPKGA